MFDESQQDEPEDETMSRRFFTAVFCVLALLVSAAFASQQFATAEDSVISRMDAILNQQMLMNERLDKLLAQDRRNNSQ